jgi:thiamine pyrophosphokinase
MTFALIANGELPFSEKMVAKIRSYSTIIAVDGGLNHCHKLGFQPHVLIGDLDSVDQENLTRFEKIPHLTFPRDKDQTDLELGIEYALKQHAKRMVVYGALGGRIDHTLFNVHLLSRYPGALFIETDSEQLFVINKKVELNCTIGQTLSLIPLNGPAKGITTRGLKWELNHAKLDKHFMGISNVALREKIQIHVDDGDLLCTILS